MTKTKAQLRAEAVERLRMLDKYGGGSFVYAILGSDKMAWPYMDKRDALIDLLTDDCDTECYECSRLAELVAENSQLRVKVDEQAERKCPGYEPESHHCRYHHQDFELNHQTVSRLKRENAELQAKVDELERENARLSSDELFLRSQMADALGIREKEQG